MRLLLRGLWWRRSLTLAVLGVAVVTTTAAALGPLYARASAESILQDHLTEAGTAAGLHFYTKVSSADPASLSLAGKTAPKPGSVNGYDSAIRGLFTQTGITTFLPSAPMGKVNSSLLWRDGECAHLIIVSGRCPRAKDEVLAAQRTVQSGYYKWHLGTELDLGQQAPKLRIVGLYRPRSVEDPFWFGRGTVDYFAPKIGETADTVDTLFGTPATFRAQGITGVEADFDYPLTASAIRLDDVNAQRTEVRRLITVHSAGSVLPVATRLPRVLDSAAGERHLVDVATLLVTLQLALLAWLVLFQVVSDALEARGNEIAMAKLRGYRSWRTIRFGLGEPLALLVLSVPLGLVLALLVTHLFAASVLVAGVPVLLTWSAVGTALIAFAGGAVAAALAGYRILTRSVLDQWRRTERRPGRGRLTLAVDVVLAAAAVAGLVVLRRSHHGSDSHGTIALLAPGLLVFAVAIVGVRLLPPLCRRLADATRATRWIGVFLAARQVSRRSVGLRLAALLGVAIGLATFGVAGESVASSNRSTRADVELGGNRVLSVQFNPQLDPVRATRRADPAGDWAMAAATWLPNGGNSANGTVLGVDTSRLAAVGNHVSGDLSTSALATLIGGSAPSPINVTTDAVRVHLTATGLRGDRPPLVQLNFRTVREPFLLAEGPRVVEGSHTYVVPASCRIGCSLRGLTWDRPILAQTTLSGSLLLTGLDVRRDGRWAPLDLGLHRPDSWYRETAKGQATDRVTVTAAGVRDEFSNTNGGYGGMTYGSDPSPIPAVATPSGLQTGSLVPHPRQLLDSLPTIATFRVQRTVSLLPVVLDYGVLLDVRYLQDELPDFVREANWQVWVSSRAPADYKARLTAAGFQIQGEKTTAGRIDQLGRQAPALALLLLLVCALAGAVLAVGGTATSISSSSRRRSYELASLRAIGVTRSSLLRASVLEQLLLLGTAVVIGLPTGLIAALLTMPIIPQFSDRSPIALNNTPDLLVTLSFAAGFVVLLVVTALVAAQALVRIAVPSRLRESE